MGLRASIFLLLALATGAGAATLAAAQSIEEERKALAEAKVQARLAARRAALLTGRAETAQDRSEQALARSAAVAARIQAAEADIGAAEARVRLVSRLQEEQRARLSARQEPALRLIAALQALSRRPPALALAQPGSTRDLVHTRATMAAVIPAIERQTEGLKAEVAASRVLKADADRALAALRASQENLRTERAALVALAARQRQESQRFALGAMAEQDRVIAMSEEARDLETLIGQLGEDAARREALARLPGPLPRPSLPGSSALPAPEPQPAAGPRRLAYRLPANGRIVTGMGEVSVNGIRSKGLTIATRPGAQIVSPADGRVVFAAPYRGYGRIAIIDHGQGFTSLITNLAILDVVVGERLLMGSPLGRAPATSPVITVELRAGNTPVDIARLIA
jgi:septal ring factor EnvC (AmiA/AmiB activator)